MLKLFDFPLMALKNVKNMLMLHKLSFNMILRIPTMTDLNTDNKALALNLWQANPNTIATTNQQHNSNLLMIRVHIFGFKTNRFSLSAKRYLMIRFYS